MVVGGVPRGDRHTYRRTDGRKDRKKDRKTGRQKTGRQRDRETYLAELAEETDVENFDRVGSLGRGEEEGDGRHVRELYRPEKKTGDLGSQRVLESPIYIYIYVMYSSSEYRVREIHYKDLHDVVFANVPTLRDGELLCGFLVCDIRKVEMFGVGELYMTSMFVRLYSATLTEVPEMLRACVEGDGEGGDCAIHTRATLDGV